MPQSCELGFMYSITPLQKGDETPERTAIPLPEGWKWDDDWQIDLGRAVDEEGEYLGGRIIGVLIVVI